MKRGGGGESERLGGSRREVRKEIVVESGESVEIDVEEGTRDNRGGEGGSKGEGRGVGSKSKCVKEGEREKTRWWKRRGEKRLGRQSSSRFDRSMRVLEWLDADCGTRLTKHYEQAGGWRSLPQRRQRLQPSVKPQRQQLRLTRSHLVLGSDQSEEYGNENGEDSGSSSSSSSSVEEGRKTLGDSEDFLNEVDAVDDDDLVLALRRWQQDEELLQEEGFEEVSMKEYVTSSDDDNKNEENVDEDSDSEDELVLALKAWKKEQEREKQLELQQQIRRQQLLSHQVLTPVLEDRIPSPTHEAFGYFYQDHSSQLYHPANDRQQGLHQQSAVTPYWWGGISSVREGPSSPPILVSQSQVGNGKFSRVVVSPRSETSARTKEANNDVNIRAQEYISKYSASVHGIVPTLTVTTALTTSACQGTLSSLHNPILPPLSPFLSKNEASNWSINRAKCPLSPAVFDPGSVAGKTLDSGLKYDNVHSVSPRTPLTNKISAGGFSVFSNWLGSASGDKHTSGYSGNGYLGSETKHGEGHSEIKHRAVCMSLSTASSDSGIEKSPGYLSPAPRSAGIEKIGEFFRRFHHKLSPSSSASKTTPPPTPCKPLQQQKPAQKSAPRRLSLSTSSIPSSSLLKPSSPSPVTKVAAAHARCSVTKSDPLATGVASKHGQWPTGQPVKSPVGLDTPGLVRASSRNIIDNISADVHCGTGEGSRGTVSGVGSAGQSGSGRLTADGGATSTGNVTPSDRKPESNIDTLHTASELKTVNPLITSTCVGKVGTSTWKDAQSLTLPPQSNQNSHYLQSQEVDQLDALTAKRSPLEISGKLFHQEQHNTAISESGGRYSTKDKLNVLKKSTEALDSVNPDVQDVNTGVFSSSGHSFGFSKLTKAASQILRKSPVSDSDQKVNNEKADRDSQGKNRTVLNCGVANVGSGNSFVSNAADSGERGSASVRSDIDGKKKTVSQKEEVMCSEVSSPAVCDDRGALSVPGAEQERGRRGSHGSCNYLFLEQTTGRKSPNPASGRKSPSPRGILFKSPANSVSTSSSSSATSSSKYHHQIISRIQSLPSPSSPPPHQQQTPKTSPKHLANVNQNVTESPTKTTTSDGPPANYHGRRKFSDTGLSPVPRRLFNEGRRGSLTDERTLVFAKSKLGKLRQEGRQSSDTGSIAALVKQIHNLWGEKDDEMDDIMERRESAGGITCSFDDQVLFDKRWKRFSVSIGRNKEGVKGGLFGGDEKKLCKKASNISEIPAENEQVLGRALGDSKGKKKAGEKGANVSVQLLNSVTASSSTAATTATEDSRCSTPDRIGTDDASKIFIEEDVSSAGSTSGNIGCCVSGSEFVAPVAHVASRQLVATAVSSAACLVRMDTPESLLNRAATGTSLTNISGAAVTSPYTKSGKKTATVQFQPIVSWDDNIVGGKVSPALRSVLQKGARRHSSFAGFSESSDDLSTPQHDSAENLSSILNKQSKNVLPKSKTSDNYKGILKQTDKPMLANELTTGSIGDKRRSKSPSSKSKKNVDEFDQSPEMKTTETSLSLCLKANKNISPKSKKSRGEGKEYHEGLDQHSQTAQFSPSEPEEVLEYGTYSGDLHTKTVGIQATPRTVGKTSNTGTQTCELPETDESYSEYTGASSDAGRWLHRLAAKCIATVGSSARTGVPGGPSGGLPRATSVRADWLLGSKRMGSGPSTPVSGSGDPKERFWVPHEVIARKRAQSLVPTLSKSEDDLSSEETTPASATHPRDLAFIFPNERPGGSTVPSEVQPSTPTSSYNLSRRRASMHDAIDLNKIDTRLYDKKLVRQASVTSIEEESQGTIHISLEHNPETTILTVNLIRAHNLLPRDLDGTANPYCRLTLLPDQRISAQCRIHRKTLNPVFEEEFIFELSCEELSISTLEVSLYEYDQFSKDECIGYVRIRLDEFDLSKRLDLWRTISPYEKPKDQKDIGDVMFSISYLPSAERLTVVVARARNLRLQEDSKADLNIFIKVCIISGNKKPKKKKTSTAHGTNSPIWNEALVFKVPREKLQSVELEVSAYHDNKLGVDECIGRVRLPADSEEGVNCQELLTEQSMPARWYCLS